MKGEDKKLRVVCDTNVLLSMLGFPGGRLDALWEIIREEKVDLFISEFILKELSKNLSVKARLRSSDVHDAVDSIKNHAVIVAPQETLRVIHHKKEDNRILECAVESRAHILITGNLKHIRPLNTFQNIKLLTPREFIDNYFPNI